ncbi:conserved Plasmodium protein, unknown function [Plasmodium ovale curtisi]|uniref:Uncharacterized protein n=1 Tax=Plasmodium ovale curtisi TaxID=864141 RepID=A0A1A8X051_PLAOA|nr:conserved Plasmodium protein, unknown function [Plasmodium ovale curtisi]
MKRKKNYYFWRDIYCNDGLISRRRFIGSKIDSKNINNFEMWKYNDNICKASLFFHKNYQGYKDKDNLLKTKISKYKNVNICTIKFLFIFLQFNEHCVNHFLSKTLPNNGIHIQVFSKLNYLLIIKKVLKNDTSLNRYIRHIYLNYVLPRERLSASAIGAPHGVAEANRNGEVPMRKVEDEDMEHFSAGRMQQLFERTNFEIVIHSNINNKYVKHVYLNKLSDSIATQINYLYMFHNKISNKKLLLQLYTFYEYFKDEIIEKKEFLFFLDRQSERMLPTMNIVDIVFIFHTHIKLTYYNHLFLYIIINKLENAFYNLNHLINEDKKVYIEKIKFNKKSIITFFHSLANYFIYLKEHYVEIRHKEKFEHIHYFIYNNISLYLLKWLENNYKQCSILDLILLYSTFLKLDIKNELLKLILFNFTISRGPLLIYNDLVDCQLDDNDNENNELDGNFPHCTLQNFRYEEVNMQIYTSFISVFSKIFVQFNYSKDEYDRVMKSLLILFENSFVLALKFFTRKGENPDGDAGWAYNSADVTEGKGINYFALINLIRMSQGNFQHTNQRGSYVRTPPPHGNIKFVVNFLNSSYKIVNHFLTTFGINEFGRNFHKTLLYNFVNNLIYNKKYINDHDYYYKRLSRCIHNSYLHKYTEKININRLFLCNYIVHFFICDMVNVYLERLIQTISLNEQCSKIVRELNHGFFFSQLVTNALGAIQNLRIRRNDIFVNVSSLVKRDIFNLQSMHIGNIIHSFASIRMRDAQIISQLLNKFCFQMEEEKKITITDQTLSNITISLLKLGYYNESLNKIILKNYKKIKSIQSLINITFYISYYNLVYKLMKTNNINHFFKQIHISNMNTLPIESKTQLKLISFLLLYIYKYSFYEKGNGGRDTLHNVFCTLFNDLRKSFAQKKQMKIEKLVEWTEIVPFTHTMNKLYNYLTIWKKKKWLKRNYIFNEMYYKANNFSFPQFCKSLNRKCLSGIFFQRTGETSHLDILSNARRAQRKLGKCKRDNYLRGKNCTRDVTDSGKTMTDVVTPHIHMNRISINMFELFCYKHMRSKHKSVHLLDRWGYLYLHFVAIFPMEGKSPNSTSSLHNEVYDVVTSLGLPREAIKEVSHHPYYVDIVLV